VTEQQHKKISDVLDQNARLKHTLKEILSDADKWLNAQRPSEVFHGMTAEDLIMSFSGAAGFALNSCSEIPEPVHHIDEELEKTVQLAEDMKRLANSIHERIEDLKKG